VATHLSSGRICNVDFIINLLQRLAVKESGSIQHSYRQECRATFLSHNKLQPGVLGQLTNKQTDAAENIHLAMLVGKNQPRLPARSHLRRPKLALVFCVYFAL